MAWIRCFVRTSIQHRGLTVFVFLVSDPKIFMFMFKVVDRQFWIKLLQIVFVTRTKTFWCVFQTAFGCCAHPKAGQNIFFQLFFNLFCSFQSFYSDFTAEITEKRLKMNKKMWFCLLLKAGRHAKAGRLPEGVPQNCLFSVDFLLF